MADQADHVRRSLRAGRQHRHARAHLSQKLSAALGQPVVIENKPGAGGNIGSDFVAKAKPDGYTILGGTISSHAINPSVYPNMPYDAVKSFEPVILIGSNPLVLAVNASTPYKTLKEVIDAAKAKPGSSPSPRQETARRRTSRASS